MILLEKVKASEDSGKIVYHYPETKVNITEWKNGDRYMFYEVTTFYKKFFKRYDGFYMDAVLSGYFPKVKIDEVFVGDEAKAVRVVLYNLYKKTPRMPQYKFREICNKYGIQSRRFRERLVEMKMLSGVSLDMEERICLKDEHKLVFSFDKAELDLLEDEGL
jgi:hypothetical protein